MPNQGKPQAFPPELRPYHDHLDETMSKKMVVQHAVRYGQFARLRHVAHSRIEPVPYLITPLFCASGKCIQGKQPVVVGPCRFSDFHQASPSKRPGSALAHYMLRLIRATRDASHAWQLTQMMPAITNSAPARNPGLIFSCNSHAPSATPIKGERKENAPSPDAR